jgi:CDP-paratose 2-epimerase
VVNVGGGARVSLSLRETSQLCEEITGNRIEVDAEVQTRVGDVRIYISDMGALGRYTGWQPRRGAREILKDIHDWLRENERAVARTLGP